MRSRVDGYMLAAFRRHAAKYTLPACGCDLDGPSRLCDLGWALWKCAHPTVSVDA